VLVEELRAGRSEEMTPDDAERDGAEQGGFAASRRPRE
jgi:hypothetical protein